MLQCRWSSWCPVSSPGRHGGGGRQQGCVDIVDTVDSVQRLGTPTRQPIGEQWCRRANCLSSHVTHVSRDTLYTSHVSRDTDGCTHCTCHVTRCTHHTVQTTIHHSPELWSLLCIYCLKSILYATNEFILLYGQCGTDLLCHIVERDSLTLVFASIKTF